MTDSSTGAKAVSGEASGFIHELDMIPSRFEATYECRHWRDLGEGTVQCRVCPHECRLRDGQHGICFVRRNVGGRLRLLSYGRVSSLAIDPVEKKPLYHFLPDTPILSVGGIGCNLSCRFCQNWHISKPESDRFLREEVEPEEIARMARAAHCPSVAFTYNEPIVALEYVVAAARACRQAGIRTVAVTNGYVQGEAREEFFAHMDAANVDLKAFSDEFYRQLAGARLSAVLETLRYIKQHTTVWLEITNLIVPGENDAPEETEAMCRWIAETLGVDVPLHFSAFFPAYRMLDHPATDGETLLRAREIARRTGLRYVYVGNVEASEAQTTYCASCGAALIERTRLRVLQNRLAPGGACYRCGSRCAGVFA